MAETVLHVVASVRVDGNFILEWDFTAYIRSIAPSRRYGVSFVLVLKIFAFMVWLDLIVRIGVLVLVDVLYFFISVVVVEVRCPDSLR